MDETYTALAKQVRELAAAIPLSQATSLASALADADEENWAFARARILSSNASPPFSARVEKLLDTWHSGPLRLSGSALALALLSAAESEEQHRLAPLIDLVWTGPDSKVIPLRRTDQALLQLIQSTTIRLLIVSFAVYKIPAVAEAIVAAAARGTSISICLESDQASEGKITFDTLRAFGPEVAARAKVYVWPLAKRPKTADGKHGSLHAKVAVADGHSLLLSSANLTEYAMNLNMELGVLIRGGPLSGKVEKHFDELIVEGVLELIDR